MSFTGFTAAARFGGDVTPGKSLASAMWPHQREAVKLMTNYLASRRHAPKGAALVTMPTTTGKTTVIGRIIGSGGQGRHWPKETH
jgi:hypothetical protein